MMLWKTAGRCAICAAALLLASFPLLAQQEHTAAPAAKSGAATGKSDAKGDRAAAPAAAAPAEGPAPQPQSPQAAVGEFQPVLHAQGAKIVTCMDTIVGESAAVIDAPHTAISSWSTAAPNDNLFLSIVGLNYANNKATPNGAAILFAAPLGSGKCEGSTVQIYPFAQSDLTTCSSRSSGLTTPTTRRPQTERQSCSPHRSAPANARVARCRFIPLHNPI